MGLALSHFLPWPHRGKGRLRSWHGAGKPLPELGGQGFWQPLVGLWKFPRAPPPVPPRECREAWGLPTEQLTGPGHSAPLQPPIPAEGTFGRTCRIGSLSTVVTTFPNPRPFCSVPTVLHTQLGSNSQPSWVPTVSRRLKELPSFWKHVILQQKRPLGPNVILIAGGLDLCCSTLDS